MSLILCLNKADKKIDNTKFVPEQCEVVLLQKCYIITLSGIVRF